MARHRHLIQITPSYTFSALFIDFLFHLSYSLILGLLYFDLSRDASLVTAPFFTVTASFFTVTVTVTVSVTVTVTVTVLISFLFHLSYSLFWVCYFDLSKLPSTYSQYTLYDNCQVYFIINIKKTCLLRLIKFRQTQFSKCISIIIL